MSFKKQLLLNLGTAFLAIVIMVFAIRLIAADIDRRALKIRNKKNEFTLRSRATAVLDDWKSSFEKAKPLFTILNQSLPTQTDLAAELEQKLANLAKTFKLELKFSLGGEIAGDAETPPASNFSLTGKGSYANFVRLLAETGKTTPFIKLVSADLVRDENSGAFNFNISAYAFHQ